VSGRGQTARPLLISTAIAVLATGAAYAFGPQASADRSAASAQRQAAAEVTVPTSAASCRVDARFPKREMRGVWIAAIHNLDWPSRGARTPERQRAEYLKILDAAVRHRLNAVFVQVRPASDALYRSSLEPWSQWLTGTAGKDPGWDPLPFLIKEAHKRGLEFHAWFNPYRAALTDDVTKLPARHPARLHPEWTVKHEGRLYYDPGLPEVRDWVTKVVTDVVRRYDVDGVHFDDYFYPYPGKGTPFRDTATYRKYGRGKPLADWRRENVNKLIAQVHAAVRKTKRHVKFGVSPFGIWRNKKQDPAGSATSGMSAYDAIYADAKAWIKAGTVDYVIPQLYWPRGYAAARYEVLAPWWADAVKGTDVHLYIGQALYQVGTKDVPGWRKPGELPAHLAINRKYPQIRGDVYFSASSLLRDPLSAMSTITKEYYRRPALLPVPERMAGRPPAAPQGVRRSGGTLVWRHTPGARAYAVYRVNGKADACAFADARNLVAIVPASRNPRLAVKGDGKYYVSALDRLTNESPAVLAR